MSQDIREMRLFHSGTVTLLVLCIYIVPATVHGDVSSAWGEWDSWSACSVTCGYGSITKTGYWFNEEGVKTNETFVQHSGCYLDIKCPVDGNWTMWSPYSACSKPCGQGIRTRTRYCTNPRPLNGGNECMGAGSDQTNCKLDDCPPIPTNFDIETCKQPGKLWCKSKRMCVEASERCDRKVQCHDGSDESLCYKYGNSARGIYLPLTSMAVWISFILFRNLT
ncbi:unnamed protein product [Mytilus edulis]|uniref:Hemicentin-1 n=1 Tax=Mytilus edulis TaxID=6550 RepID=A0A8S3RPH4_MYTED|nr:unnamed protein product [Mytilus edulis]